MLLLPDPERPTVPREISTSRGELFSRNGSGLESTWQVAATERGDFHYVPPDTCTDVILAIDPDGRAQPLTAAPDCSFAVVPRQRGWSYVGARIRPGFGRILLESAGTRSPLPPVRVQDLGDARIALADVVCELTSSRRHAPPSWIGEVARVGGDFRLHRGNVAALARHVGVSPRTLHRGMVAWVGLTPKAFLRVERARIAANLLACGHEASGAAFVAGFADQPHMTRELRSAFGFSPREMQTFGPVTEFFKMFLPSRPTFGA